MSRHPLGTVRHAIRGRARHLSRFAIPAVVLLACTPSPPRAAAVEPVAEQRFVGCGPCVVRVSPGLPEYRVFMDTVEDDIVGTLATALRVHAAGDSARTAQVLPVSEEIPRGAAGLELIALDLNGDGYADLALSTGQGMVNSYYDYWLFQPARNRFVRLGNYPSLDRVGHRGELATFERGGAGSYTRHRYRFIDGKLTRVHSDVTGAAEPASDTIVRVVQVRRGQRMVPICREAILSRDSAGAELRDTFPSPTRCPAELAPDQPTAN